MFNQLEQNHTHTTCLSNQMNTQFPASMWILSATDMSLALDSMTCQVTDESWENINMWYSIPSLRLSRDPHLSSLLVSGSSLNLSLDPLSSCTWVRLGYIGLPQCLQLLCQHLWFLDGCCFILLPIARHLAPGHSSLTAPCLYIREVPLEIV